MLTTVQKWGNSQGLRLARGILQDAQIEVGDEVDVVVRDGVIVIAPVQRRRGRHRLEELVSRIPAGYRPEEVAWDPRVGKEAW
jgi:antitoxin MazE